MFERNPRALIFPPTAINLWAGAWDMWFRMKAKCTKADDGRYNEELGYVGRSQVFLEHRIQGLLEVPSYMYAVGKNRPTSEAFNHAN